MYNLTFRILIPSVTRFHNFVFFIVAQESLEERVQELEQTLLAERIAAQRDRATITKLQRQINKVSRAQNISQMRAEMKSRKVGIKSPRGVSFSLLLLNIETFIALTDN